MLLRFILFGIITKDSESSWTEFSKWINIICFTNKFIRNNIDKVEAIQGLTSKTTDKISEFIKSFQDLRDFYDAYRNWISPELY